MPELSPAAQAVWEAFNEDEAGVFVDYGEKLAAALEALADQVVPEERQPDVPDFPDSDQIAPYYEWLCRREIRAEILAIAVELRGQDQHTKDSD